MLLCLKYSKENEARFLSHLDLMRTMERSFRRARLPLAFSEGFNPHPRVSFASALAVGVTSEAEYLDVQLQNPLPAQDVMNRVNNVLPSGLQILAAQSVTKRQESLMALINRACYRVKAQILQPISPQTVEQTISQVLSLPAYVVKRQGKKGVHEVDLRPGLFRLAGTVAENLLCLEIEVQTGSAGNVRPEEIMEMVRATGPFSLGNNLHLHRLGLYINMHGKNWSPLEVS